MEVGPEEGGVALPGPPCPLGPLPIPPLLAVGRFMKIVVQAWHTDRDPPYNSQASTGAKSRESTAANPWYALKGSALVDDRSSSMTVNYERRG